MLPASSLILLSCRSPFLDDSKVYCPLANLYLKAYLNKHAPAITVALGDDDYELEDLSALEPFDVVGISIMTPQRHEAITLAESIKRRWPQKIIIAGGPHARYYCESLAEKRCFDYVVPMDGERALVAILTGRSTGKIVRDVLSRDDIAAQPRPDRLTEEARNLLRRYRYELGSLEATTMMTARGCPEQCTFCEDAQTAVRRSSVENLRGEISDIAGLGYKGVYIFDDLFALAPSIVRPICSILNEYQLRYRCNAQARYFTRWGDEMARILGGTGCYEIAFGAESGSQKILDNVRKRCTVQQNYQTVEFAKKQGIKVKAFILLGLPGEDWETLLATEEFVRNSGCDDYQFAVYMPFRGTAIRAAIERGDKEIDLEVVPAGSDGDISGAYGIRGGETAYEVRTKALSASDLHVFRDYLVSRYRPESHKKLWDNSDRFFDQAFVHNPGSDLVQLPISR
jgi:radical SAM superfamily enzyme YgiQ (UPF0313 family)